MRVNVTRLVVGTAAMMVAFAVALFLPSGTLAWSAGWAFDTKEPPLRLPLGTDAVARIEEKNAFVARERATCRDLSASTDFPPGSDGVDSREQLPPARVIVRG